MTVERPRHLGISTLWIALRGRQGVEPVEQREAGKNGDYRARSFSEPEVSAQLQLSMRGFAFLPSTFGAPSGHHPAICCESKRPSLQNEFRERVQVLVKNMDLRFSPDGYLSWMSRNSCRETRKSFPNQSRKGRKNPEPGTAVPGKESNGNQVPFRGRHNQLAGSPPFQSLRFPLTITYHGCPSHF
jgi:hypothetical protein